MAAAPLVTVDLWRVPTRLVGAALVRMATGRAHLRRLPGLRFAKLVGTGAPGGFSPTNAEPRRWGLVAAWDSPAAAAAFSSSPPARSWARIADEHFHVDLRPLASRGRWSGRDPFGPLAPAAPGEPPADTPAAGTAQPVLAVLTRARLAPRRAVAFWRAAPAVAADLAALPPPVAPLLALGIGEAPIGLQGTFSLWPDLAAAREFAYRRAAHAAVVRRTSELGWYAEELFARFAVLGGHGTVDGRDPLRRPPSAGPRGAASAT
ncbi:MAG: spheroidene monooxygenase [Frankia sp.]|nr:spheroidene monooxygenase [Frankia sp.]